MAYLREETDTPIKDYTVKDALETQADLLGGHDFLYYGPDETELTFSETNARANAIANSLIPAGIEKGDKVSVMVREPLAAALSMFGINKAGAVYAPINFEYKGDVLKYQINDTAPEVLVIDDQYLDRLAAIWDELDTPPELVINETSTGGDLGVVSPEPERIGTFADILEGSTENPEVTVEWDDEAGIVYTSGTTGRPKGVVIPHRWIFGNYNSDILMNTEDVTHCVLPFYHVGAAYWVTTSALAAGSSVALWDRFSRSQFWDRINRYEATKVTLVSVMVPWLMNLPEKETDNHNTLNKVVLNPLPGNYEEIAERFGFDFIINAFGQTESGNPLLGLIHAAKGDAATPADLKRGLTGQDLINRVNQYSIDVVDSIGEERYLGRPKDDIVEVAVLNERDEKVPPGEVGELAIRSKEPGMLLKEYYGKPEQTVDAFRNLWFHTGDAVYRDEDDNYFFVDRIGSVIRRRGENISSIQIQDAVNGLDAVQQAAVFPVPAEEGGEDEIGVAAIVEDNSLSTDELLEQLAPRLPEFMLPDRVWFVDEIPSTETNKMEKYKLQQQLLGESRR